MDPINDIQVESNVSELTGTLTPERQRRHTTDHYLRMEYNGSPLPNVIQAEDEQHSLVGVADYKLKIISPGNKLTRKKINIENPIGHLITKSWANIQNEYMIDLNYLMISIEITKEDVYEFPELVLKMKNDDEIRLKFDTVDEARDCYLYLYSILKKSTT